MPNPREDQYLGALLGLAIGDAMGMPVRGQSPTEIAAGGAVTHYRPGVRTDGEEIGAGEFTDETEIVLCIVEGATANGGQLDVDTIGARLGYLATGDSRHWMHPFTLDAIQRADATLTFQAPLNEDDPATADVAARGVVVGLLHAIGKDDPAAMAADAGTVARFSHGSPAASAAVLAVAAAIRLAARGEVESLAWPAAIAATLGTGQLAARLGTLGEVLAHGGSLATILSTYDGSDLAEQVVPAALAIAILAPDFPAAVLSAANTGGATDALGGIAGAISGAQHGVAAIPQGLIDDLEGRIYLSLAAPWLFRAVLLRSGEIIDLRRREPPRPDLPPRF